MQVVSQLNKIQRLRAHDFLDLIMTTTVRGGHTYLENFSLLLELLQTGQMRFPGNQIVRLIHAKTVNPPQSE